MTDRAQPGAQGSTLRNIEIGEATGSLSDGFIVPSSDPTLSAQRFNDINEGNFNEFDASWSSSSLDVTIDPGEAFIKGWLATDDTHTVTLDDFTDGQTVVVAWDVDAVYDDSIHDNREEADRVIITREADLPTTPVPYIPVWEFDTDGDGVTAAVDRRAIGRPGSQSNPKESFHTDEAEITEKNMIPKYNTTDDAPDDAGLFLAEDSGRLAFKEVI